MDNEEIQGVKFSEFQSATPDNADEVVGLHSGNNARFSVANFILAIRQGIANLFVPTSRTVNGKALSSDITLDASDVGLGNVANERQYSSNNPPPYPVTSVNGSTGAVTVSVPSASDSTPQDLGTAAAGSSGDFSRADHVHKKPTASDIGAYVKPSGGIPASDLANGVIPSVPSISTATPQMDGTGAAGSTGEVSDAGHTHPSDTSKADETELAYVESGTTASRNYSVKEYFCMGGALYKVISPISSGASFNSGSGGNCVAVSGGGLNDLNSNFKPEYIYRTVVPSGMTSSTYQYLAFDVPVGCTAAKITRYVPLGGTEVVGDLTLIVTSFGSSVIAYLNSPTLNTVAKGYCTMVEIKCTY